MMCYSYWFAYLHITQPFILIVDVRMSCTRMLQLKFAFIDANINS